MKIVDHLIVSAAVLAPCAACTAEPDPGLLYPAWHGTGAWTDAATEDDGGADAAPAKWEDAGAAGSPVPVDAGSAWSVDAAPDGADPRGLFEALLPTFSTTCGPCHVQGTSNAPAYLGGADPYATIKTYAGIVVANPAQSLLLTKGSHEGPALVDPLRTSIVTWLTAEAPTAAAAPVSTPAFAVTQGANSVDLSKWVPGASLTFEAVTTGDVLTLSAITLVAPAASGAHVVYPLFYIVPTSGPQIVNQTFSNVDLTVGAGQSAIVGPGVAPLNSWTSGDLLRIAFKTLAPAAG